MKRVLFAVVLVLCASSAFAQSNAQYCWSAPIVVCQYLADEPFSQGTTYWWYSSGSGQSTVTDPCAWGGGTSSAANLEPGDSVLQDVYTDNFDQWSIDLDLYKTSTSVGANDYFKVIVYNYTTFASETHYVYASNVSGLCGSNISINLTNNHANSLVRVRIDKSPTATATMYVDNVSFWGW